MTASYYYLYCSRHVDKCSHGHSDLFWALFVLAIAAIFFSLWALRR